jgi:signal transduction histidine kinase
MNQSESNNSTDPNGLRNPLGTIMMSLEEFNPFCASDNAAHRTREMAMEAVQHMSRLIDDAMDLCRVRRNSLEPGTETVDLVQTVSTSIRNCHRLLAQKSHDLALELPVGKVYVRAHPTRLQQIVTNLLTNSANYTNPGGRIFITIETAGNLITLKVRDNGVGLARKYYQHLRTLLERHGK